MYRLLPCIRIFRRGGVLKVDMLKIALVLVKNMLLGLKKGISRLVR